MLNPIAIRVAVFWAAISTTLILYKLAEDWGELRVWRTVESCVADLVIWFVFVFVWQYGLALILAVVFSGKTQARRRIFAAISLPFAASAGFLILANLTKIAYSGPYP